MHGKSGPEATVEADGQRRLVAAAVRLMRPRQWVKNLLVAVAPLADGSLDTAATLRQTAVAGLAFTLAAAAAYVHNDIVDRSLDAVHPDKRARPIASGRIGVGAAGLLAGVTAALSLVVAVAGSGVSLAVIVTGYLLMTALYSGALKHVALLDVGVVSAGFLLRVLAGAAATGVTPSMLLLVTVGATALFVAAGKRYSEAASVGAVARPGLDGYSLEFLRTLWVIGATVAIVGGILWGIEVADTSVRPGLARASVAPLVLVVLRYLWWVDLRRAQAPEDVLLRDPVLLGLATLWGVLFALGVGSLGVPVG